MRELEELSTKDGVNDAGREVHTVELRVPENLLYFQGHFKNDPVLPGVVQLNTVVLSRIERRWPELGRLEKMRRLKFIQIIRPGDVIAVRLERKATPNQVGLVITKGDEVCTTASLIFAEETES